MSEITHIMLDLETLSTHTNARILAIGAVKFTEAERISDKFYQPIKALAFETLNAVERDFVDPDGFHVSRDTLDWWGQQSEKAQAVFEDPQGITISEALTLFAHWVLSSPGDIKDIRMWGNGAEFDNVILSTAYRLCDKPAPWRFYNNRCYRTVKSLFPTEKIKRLGTHHNALDDALSQAEHLLSMGVWLGK